jgi:hypothetical protein
MVQMLDQMITMTIVTVMSISDFFWNSNASSRWQKRMASDCDCGLVTYIYLGSLKKKLISLSTIEPKKLGWQLLGNVKTPITMQICPHLFYSSEFSLIFHNLLLRRTHFSEYGRGNLFGSCASDLSEVVVPELRSAMLIIHVPSCLVRRLIDWR